MADQPILHRIIEGGAHWLPFAQSYIRRLRATGMTHAAKRLPMPDGATVAVRIEPGHDHIHLTGGVRAYATGVVGNRRVVRYKSGDGHSDWLAHSTISDAHVFEYEGYDISRISAAAKTFALFSSRTENVPGSDEFSAHEFFVDGFGRTTKIYSGVLADDLSGLAWLAERSLSIITDGIKGIYLLTAVEDVTNGVSPYNNIGWKCEHIAFKSNIKTPKPTMWAFAFTIPWDEPPFLAYGMHTHMTPVAYVGSGKFVYAHGGSAQSDGDRTVNFPEKMSIIVTDNFETFVDYDVQAGLGGLYGAYLFALDRPCYIGNGKVLFGGKADHHGNVTTDMIVFDSTTGGMTRRFTYDASPYLTSRQNPGPIGEDSACYWEDSAAGFTFIYTTDQGISWSVKPITCVDENGAPLTISQAVGWTTLRKPLVKVDGVITKNGEIATIFHVAGIGHVEFRTKDLGTTWVKNGIVSTAPLNSDGGLTFLGMEFDAPGLDIRWR